MLLLACLERGTADNNALSDFGLGILRHREVYILIAMRLQGVENIVHVLIDAFIELSFFRLAGGRLCLLLLCFLLTRFFSLGSFGGSSFLSGLFLSNPFGLLLLFLLLLYASLTRGLLLLRCHSGYRQSQADHGSTAKIKQGSFSGALAFIAPAQDKGRFDKRDDKQGKKDQHEKRKER